MTMGLDDGFLTTLGTSTGTAAATTTSFKQVLVSSTCFNLSLVIANLWERHVRREERLGL